VKKINHYLPYCLLCIGCIISLTQCKSKKVERVLETSSTSLLIGTYTRSEGHVDGKAVGITLWDTSGFQSTVAPVVNPSFIVLDKSQSYLYAVSETGPADGPSGVLYSYALKNGSLLVIDSIATNGFAPCHVSVDKTGGWVFVANYMGGAISIFRSNDGQLEQHQIISFQGSGTHPRQEAPHMHMVKLSPNEAFLYAVDLGSNMIWNFTWDKESNTFSPNPAQVSVALTDGAGPRHMDFHPNGQFVFVLNELNSTVTVLSHDDQTGVLTSQQEITTIPADWDGKVNQPADIHVHPSGQFLYVSNRGHNSLAIYRIEDGSQLVLIGHQTTLGDYPRNFKIDPNGEKLWVANQNTDNLVRFAINTTSGQLSKEENFKQVMTPVCIELLK
jgi:6-phosphogluconolactonase